MAQRILVVDDEAAIRDTLRMVLEYEGYDVDLIASVASAVPVPVIACGGAGTRRHLADPVLRAGASAAAAGSIFVFQSRRGGVLVNFPSRDELSLLLSPERGP